MKVNVCFGTALWIGLAWAGSASSSQAASVADLVRIHAGGCATGAFTDVSAAPLTLGAEPQTRPDFSGLWSLNAQASDDPQEKVREAMKAMKQAKGGGRGMGGRRQGRGSSGGMGGRSEMSFGELPELTATAERLDISNEDPLLLIADENDQRRQIFTDFRGASVSISDSVQQREAVAGWEGTALVVETTIKGGTGLIQGYQIDAGTGQLMISAAARLSEIQPVSYRLVYDRIKPGTDDGSR